MIPPQTIKLYARYVLVGILGLVFTTELLLSTQWRMEHDTPMLHYTAYLISELGYAPYRDVFETSMPGTMLFHRAIGSLLGWGDGAFRMVDIVWLSLLLICTWLIMRRLSRTIALVGMFGFALFYFGAGPGMSLQRDYIGILPIALALLVAADSRHRTGCRAIAIGALFGAAVTIKPQLGIGLPIVLGYQLANNPTLENLIPRQLLPHVFKTFFLAGVGLTLIVALVVGWVWSTGGLAAFVEMVRDYLPLHIHLTGTAENLPPDQHFTYLLRGFRNGIRLWLLPAAGGVAVALLGSTISRPEKLLAITLGLLALAYAIIPVLAGQFWPYHWMPFRYFGILCAAMLLLPLKSAIQLPLKELLLTLFLAAFLLSVINLKPFQTQLRVQAPKPPKNGRVDAIAAFLQKADLQPDERVQPLDWVGGAGHAMLITETQLSSRFLYDYHFYHNVSNPVIRRMRAEFIASLRASPPRFFIRVPSGIRPHGIDSSKTFAALDHILKSEYKKVYNKNKVIIFERRSSPDIAD